MSRLRWMRVGWWCRKCEGTWHLFLMSDECTEGADNLVVGMFIGETNKGHGFIIVVGHMVCVTWAVVRNAMRAQHSAQVRKIPRSWP